MAGNRFSDLSRDSINKPWGENVGLMKKLLQELNEGAFANRGSIHDGISPNLFIRTLTQYNGPAITFEVDSSGFIVLRPFSTLALAMFGFKEDSDGRLLPFIKLSIYNEDDIVRTLIKVVTILKS